MKKLFLVMLFLATLCGVKAQESIRYGAVLGLNLSKYSASVMDSKAGFHLGAKAEIEASQLFDGAYFNVAALLSLKGAKINGGELMDIKFNPWYLEIPIQLGYKYELSDNFSVFGKFGPYLAIGLFGKAKSKTADFDFDEDYEMVETSSEEKLNIFGKDGMKRFDLGLGLHVGVEFQQKYQLSLGYDWGLLKTYKDNSEVIDLASGMKNRNFSLSLAYMF